MGPVPHPTPCLALSSKSIGSYFTGTPLLGETVPDANFISPSGHGPCDTVKRTLLTCPDYGTRLRKRFLRVEVRGGFQLYYPCLSRKVGTREGPDDTAGQLAGSSFSLRCVYPRARLVFLSFYSTGNVDWYPWDLHML